MKDFFQESDRDENRSIANEAIQKKSKEEGHFEDNSPEAIQMRKLQGNIDNSDESIQMNKLQTHIDNSDETKQLMAFDNAAQGHDTAQLQEKEEELSKQKDTELSTELQSTGDDNPEGEQAAVPNKPNNTGLPDNLKLGIENLSGYSLDDVKVHYNSAKPAEVQAHAYAQGTDIYLGPGQEKHLPHEAWHVVQQMQGRVKPTLQMKDGVDVNDDSGLEKEADVMGLKGANITATQSQLKNVNINNNIAIQRKGEAESLEKITSTGGNKREMRRGNNRNSIIGTSKKSMAWIHYLRKDNLAIDLKKEVKNLYLAAYNPLNEFDAWYQNREKVIKGLVYKYVQYGNCGEFATALYGDLQQSTSNQYIYKAEWMWAVKSKDETSHMKKFKSKYPNRMIKADNADHAFVVTYPDLVTSENLKYIPAKWFGDPKFNGMITTNYYQQTRFKISDMDPDLAMVADGWLNRKVKTLKDTGYDDTNLSLTEPIEAGKFTIDSTMLSSIVSWAENFKKETELSNEFNQDTQKELHPGLYGDESNKGKVVKDCRPNYIRAFHGKTATQPNSFNDACKNDPDNLINYTKKITDKLILELGNEILKTTDMTAIKNFFILLEKVNKMHISKVITDKMIADLEQLIGEKGFDRKMKEINKKLKIIPDKIIALNKQVLAYKVIVDELENLIGKNGFNAKNEERRAIYNSTLRYEKRIPILEEHRVFAYEIIDLNKQVLAYEVIVDELKNLIGKNGFNAKNEERRAIYNSIYNSTPRYKKRIPILEEHRVFAYEIIDFNEKN
jgi:hypothetical protein